MLKNKKKVILFLLAISSVLVLFSFGQTLFAKNKSKYQSAKENLQKTISETDNENERVELPKVSKKGNKESKNLKTFSQLYECENDNELDEKFKKNNKKLLKKELLTYEEFIEEYDADAAVDFSTEPDRMIWVSVIHNKGEVYTMRGSFNNVIVTTFYDAETGEDIGYKIESYDKKPLEVRSPWDEEEANK
ncbi:MAG: hypothetical protein GX270_05605 [Clostridiaceae bacterium]|jgi:hypothetical protein|nr:hypothetical protein [Clostridiaceae bacterium]